MKYGIREYGVASCKVLKPIGLPEHMHKDVREVVKVYVPPEARGQGLATKLLEEVCKEADKFKMVLLISVEPYDDEPMTKEQLANWYGSTFNFNQIQEEPMLMARMYSVYVKPKLSPLAESLLGAV